jgi:hypothetical protein
MGSASPASTRVRPVRSPQTQGEFDARVVVARDGDQEGYAWAVHNFNTEPYQPAWIEALENEDRVLIVCPPDTYKSTTVRLFVERMIGLNHNIRILWIMGAGEQAEKNVMTISQTIESNPVYKKAFHVVPDKRLQWTKSVLFVKRDFSSPDPTLMATGVNGPYQGLHFDLIILDDLTDQEDVRSPTTMEHQRNKLRGVILDRLVEAGRIVAIMTRWGVDDLHDTYQAMDFRVVTMPIVGKYPWGPTLSPLKFPMDRVEGIRRDKGDYLFNMTYMCDVRGAMGAIISREHIGYWDPWQLKNSLQLFVGIDPAPSTSLTSDRSAIATVGLDLRTRKIYQVDMWAARVEVPDLRDKIVRLVNQTSDVRKVALETIGFQLGLMQDLRRLDSLPMMEIPYRTRENVKRRVLGIDRSKAGRAMYLDSLFTRGKLLLSRNNPILDGVSLESELCTFGSEGQHNDDRADALSFACIAAESAVAYQNLEFEVAVGY